MTFFEELKWRGLVKDMAGENLEEKINQGGITFYWGTDPTANSLHLGHYSSLVTAKRFAQKGNHPILLVGGATALIGDPRPTAEREIISKATVLKNVEGLKSQVIKLVPGATVVNNYDWLKDFTFLDFLRDVGKYINVNYMLNKDIIRRRLESGITYAEFSYTLMQGYDYLHLFQEKNCTLQAAGSDQWGNITTGIELIKKITGKEAYGFTMPLILDKEGKKFGKSEGNALWLDENKTSSYELYQYLINTDDSMVINYLKIFTFLTKDEIENIETEMNSHPESRIAQKELAHQIIKDIHGEESYEHAKEVSECLFTGKVSCLSDQEIETVFKGVPTFSYKKLPLIDILVNNKIVSSKREAREFLSASAISLNGKIVTDEMTFLESKHYNIIRRGKKKYYLIQK